MNKHSEVDILTVKNVGLYWVVTNQQVFSNGLSEAVAQGW